MELAADVIIERPVSEVLAYFEDHERAPERAAPVVAPKDDPETPRSTTCRAGTSSTPSR